jgi:hypothetical protein
MPGQFDAHVIAFVQWQRQRARQLFPLTFKR